MIYENEFLFTGIFFFLFLVIITTFGFLFIFIIHKDFINFPLIQIIPISLGCGFVFFICFSYIIELLLFFNFITILLPIIVFNIGGLIYFINSNSKVKEKLNLSNIKDQIIKNGREIIIFIVFFLVIFYFQLQIQFDKIIPNESQLSKDPFLWCRLAMYLLDYGHLEDVGLEFYSMGYVFLNAGMTSFYPNFRFIYFFHKYVPIFYMILIIFIGYFISGILFKQQFLRFLTMFGFFTLNYFNYRFLMPLPSVLATILFFIMLISFINKKIPFYLKGILLAGIFLFHPVYGAIGFGIYFAYIIYHFFILIIKERESKKVAFKFLKESIYNILIFFGLLFPYLIYLTINNPSWYVGFWNSLFPSIISVSNVDTNFTPNYTGIFNFPVLILNNFSFTSLLNFLNQFTIYIWRDNTWFFFFLIYFFIRIRKKNYKDYGHFIEIIKIAVIFLLLFHFSSYFMNWFSIANIPGLFKRILAFKVRIFEFGAGLFILIFIFSIYDIYFLFSIITIKLKNKFPKYKKFLDGRDLHCLKEKIFKAIKSPSKIESIVIIVGIYFTYNLYINNNFYYNYRYHDNDFVEMFIELGDSEPIDSNITILLPFIEEKIILHLLYRYNYEFIQFNQSYIELIDQIISKDASYIVLPIKEISEEIVINFGLSFEILYKYSKYMVVKIK